MLTTLKLPAYAKLNLALDVLAKRPDGFHELSTLFERINLADTIELKLLSKDDIQCVVGQSVLPVDERNLVVKIAKRLKADFKIRQGVRIILHKHIPIAAGLAGGSSNGATVLMGLNQLWHLGLSQQQLLAYAAWLGSDVAFFIYNTPFAIGRGRGEQITPVKLQTVLYHVLVTPRVSMLTKEVFARLKLKLTNKNDNVNILLPFLRQGDIKGLSEHLSNDLEGAILSLRPDFLSLKKKLLSAGALGVCFSGSGPSVYAMAESLSHAQAIKNKFDRRYSQVFVVKTQ